MHCENNGVFGEMQSAYRRNRCTTDNLLKLNSERNRSVSMVRNVGQMLPRYRKSVRCSVETRTSKQTGKIGLHKPVIKLVNSFLSLRTIFVKIKISKK